MPFPSERIKGREVYIEVNGNAVTHWESIEINPSWDIENPQSADAEFKQKVLDIRDATGKISVFLGASNNNTTLPKLGDEITAMSAVLVADPGEDVMPPEDMFNPAKWGRCRVTSNPRRFGQKATQIEFDIEWGFIDFSAT